MLGSQMKWAKFLSANLPKVDETNQNKEEIEELNEEVYKFKNTIFLSGWLQDIQENGEPIRVKMRKGLEDDDSSDHLEELWANMEGEEESGTKFLMVGDVLTVERAGRDFSPVELELLRKVEMERASLLPSLVKVIPVYTMFNKIWKNVILNISD